MSQWNIWQQCGKSHNTLSLMNITVSGFLFKFIMTWIFTITKQKVKCYSGKKECGLVKRDTLTELSLTHKFPFDTLQTVETSIFLSSSATIHFPWRQPYPILLHGLLWHWKRPLIKTFVFLSACTRMGEWVLTPEGDVFVPIRVSSRCHHQASVLSWQGTYESAT